MRKINYYRVDVTDPMDGGIIGAERKFEVKTFNVLGENPLCIVIDDLYFTTIRKGKAEWATCLDKPSISLHARDRVYGTRVSYTLYTERTKRAATIRKEIEEAIKKKYGFARGVDLSFIAEGGSK